MTRWSARWSAAVLAAVIAATTVLVGCQALPGRTGSAERLVGPRWLLARYSTEDSPSVAVQPDVDTWLSFAADGSFEAGTGVNDLEGRWSGGDESIAFELGAMTEKGGAAQAMEQERAFLEGLRRAASYIVAGSGSERALSLRDESGRELLVFDATRVIPLSGSQWRCTAYDDGSGALVTPVVGSTITATFGEDDSLVGSAGCNDYSTSFEAGDEKLTIAPEIAITTRACPADIAAQETAFLSALKRAATYSIVGTRLLLTDAQGVTVARFDLAP